MSLQEFYTQYQTLLRPMLRIGPLIGGVAMLAWRVREARVPVSIRAIVIPPLAMGSGFFMFFSPVNRVPSLHDYIGRRKAGMDVRIVYSPSDALKLARLHPDRHVMFFAIGFETTAPSTALTLMRAKAEGIRNFSVFCNHVTIIPAIRAILDSPDMRLDAFIGPGHVSTVIGCRPYEWIKDFPPVSGASKELKEKVLAKYGHFLKR